MTVALASIGLGAVLAACGDSSNPVDESAPSPGGTVELTESDSGSTITAAVGDVVVIRLGANPGTGFEWVTELDGPGSVAEVDRAYVAGADDEGSPGQEVIRFRAESAGTTLITLDYRRPWEEEVEPERTVRITVAVSE